MKIGAISGGTVQRPLVGFAGLCLGYFAIILDGSVLNVAIPALQADLDSSTAQAQWVLNGYTLTLAALLLTMGALGDRVGLRRMLLVGMAVFTVASGLCAVAPSTGPLVAARVLQGLGAATLLPATLALIPHIYDDAVRRARAAVVWVATGAGSVALGPLAGGLLIDAFGWRSIFLINLPVVGAGMVLASVGLAETPRHVRRVDHAGQLSAVVALGAITAGVIASGAFGWSSPLTLGLLAVGVGAGAVFWRVEHRVGHPMLPPDLLAVPVRAVAVLSAALMGFLFYGTLYVMSLNFQLAQGLSPGATGIALLPLTVGSLVGPLVAYRPLAHRYGHRTMLLVGFTCCALGTAVLAATLTWARTGGAYPVVAVGLLLTGMASTVAFSALTSLLLADVPTGQSGVASGVQNTTRQSGALLSVAVLGSVLNTSALTGRIPVAFAVLLAVAVVAVLVAGVGRFRIVSPEPARSRSRDAPRDRPG